MLAGVATRVALGVLIAAPAAAQDQPVFHTAPSELVVLPVTVTDRSGRLVADLTADRFAVLDNGRRQAISLFTGEDTPVSVAVVIDDSGSMRGRMGQVIAATLGFARSSNPDDEIFVIEFNERVRDALGGRALTASDTADLSAALHTLRPDGRSAVFDALMDGLDHLERAARVRRVLILVSDGGDNASTATLAQVLARARHDNVTIYTIGLLDGYDRDANPSVLKELASTTGGERFMPESPGKLMQACLRIAREIRSGYTLGFVPPERDGGFHRVQVTVEGPDARSLVLRTRPGYFAAGGPR
jgi:Ca-activated chloride channel homolog